MASRGGSRNSLWGGGGSGPEFFEGGGGVRVQVRGNFHILTSKKNTTSEGGGGGGKPPTPPPPPGSATGFYIHCCFHFLECHSQGLHSCLVSPITQDEVAEWLMF